MDKRVEEGERRWRCGFAIGVAEKKGKEKGESRVAG
jgi:hypothetical protein